MSHVTDSRWKTALFSRRDHGHALRSVTQIKYRGRLFRMIWVKPVLHGTDKDTCLGRECSPPRFLPAPSREDGKRQLALPRCWDFQGALSPGPTLPSSQMSRHRKVSGALGKCVFVAWLCDPGIWGNSAFSLAFCPELDISR